jgi:hypothetical protein
MSQVQTPKPKPCMKVMNTPTNSIETPPSKLWTRWKRMWSNGHRVSKIWPKQWINIAAETARRTGPTLDQKCLVLEDISVKRARYVRSTQKISSQLWFLSYGAQQWMKLGHKGHHNRRNKFPKRFFLNSKISLSILDELDESRFWEKREKSAKSKGLEPWIHSKIGGRWWGSS